MRAFSLDSFITLALSYFAESAFFDRRELREFYSRDSLKRSFYRFSSRSVPTAPEVLRSEAYDHDAVDARGVTLRMIPPSRVRSGKDIRAPPKKQKRS